MGANGAWTYTASSAQDPLAAGAKATDIFTVHAADGTATSITVNITGTNDAAVISGTRVIELRETNDVLTTEGTLTSTDVDGVVNAFIQETVTGTYGSLRMGANGRWVYSSSSAQDQLAEGEKVTDIFTVHAADATASTITVNITGTNDGAAISVEYEQLNVIEAGGIHNATQGNNASGKLTIADVDSANTFIAESGVLGDYAFGSFSIDPTGAWTYTLNQANSIVDALNMNSAPLIDRHFIKAADGTTKKLEVTIYGANDLPVVVVTDSDSRVTVDQGAKAVPDLGFGVYGTDVDVNAPSSYYYDFVQPTELFTINHATGAISLTTAGAANFADNLDPVILGIKATNDVNSNGTPNLNLFGQPSYVTVSVHPALSSDGTARLPGSINDWNFASALVVVNGVSSNGYVLSRIDQPSIAVKIPVASAGTTLSFFDSTGTTTSSVLLLNDGTSGTIETKSLASGVPTITVSPDVFGNTMVLLSKENKVSVVGAADFTTDPFNAFDLSNLHVTQTSLDGFATYRGDLVAISKGGLVIGTVTSNSSTGAFSISLPTPSTGHTYTVQEFTAQELPLIPNFRSDRVEINGYLSDATFQTSSDNTHVVVTMHMHNNSGVVVGQATLTEVEVVKFLDQTVRIVGAGGYTDVAEAQLNADSGDLIYYDSTVSNPLAAHSGTGYSSNYEILDAVTDNTANPLKIPDTTTNNTIIELKPDGHYTIVGASEDTSAVQARRDVVFMNANMSQATFTSVKVGQDDYVKLDIYNSNHVVTGTSLLRDIEAVQFNDATVLLATANGYLSAADAVANNDATLSNVFLYEPLHSVYHYSP
jgi:VCBS repeat-containing protein